MSTYTEEEMLEDLDNGVSPEECSRRKWERIAREGGEDKGVQNCALCKEYNSDTCYDCILCDEDGVCYEDRLPYGAWDRHHSHAEEHDPMHKIVRCPECQKLADEVLTWIEKKIADNTN